MAQVQEGELVFDFSTATHVERLDAQREPLPTGMALVDFVVEEEARVLLEWLLRCVNAVVTGEALFTALRDVDIPTLQEGLNQAEKSVDTLINLIASRLGLDHDRVLGSRYSFPIMARYLTQRGGYVPNPRERDKLLYWYIHTFLWGRYTGSTESALNQDLNLMDEMDGALDRLINQLRQNRGDLRIQANDFVGWSRGARFYPLLYMLTRVCHSRDWDTGVELSKHMLGHLSSLALHHIFPKSVLYDYGYSQSEVNALANFTFLTQDAYPEPAISFPSALVWWMG